MSRYKPRDIPCVDCGALVFRVPRWDRPILCIDCGTIRSVRAVREMANKSGPAWSNWLASKASGAPGPEHIDSEG